MLPKNCGQLLFNAVRETLETMAFAEVIPCSIKVGGEECPLDDDFSVNENPMPTGDAWGEAAETEPADTWGTAVPESPGDDGWGSPDATVGADDAWGTPDASGSDAASADDAWGTPAAVTEDEGDSWGEPDAEAPVADDAWGQVEPVTPEADPWGESAGVGGQVDGIMMKPKDADFENMVEDQGDWCWACMKVNSPDIHSVWFIISKGLANALAQNMYAGEDFQLDNPLIRDLIAELTNVLGGRLMLLLEELGGEFTLTVPEIGFGMPEIPETVTLETVLCKVVVDGEFPVIVALCFNQGGIAAPDK